MASSHHLKLRELPLEESDGGSRIKANKLNFPILEGMSLNKLTIHPMGVREPHWHANADELGYCLKGEVLINIYKTGDERELIYVKAGEAFFIPSGAFHHIENAGNISAELLLEFSHENNQEFNLSDSFRAFSHSVLGNAWKMKSADFHDFKPRKDFLIRLRQSNARFPDGIRESNPHRFDLMGEAPALQNEGGSVRKARGSVWPILKQQALYTLQLTGSGMREPHWHPETAELGYVHSGKGRISVVQPTGETETFIIEEGDIYFIPKSYIHHIENLQNENLHLFIFFDQRLPQDIGFTGSLRSFSDDVLALSAGTAPDFFSKLPPYDSDRLIVTKINPVDSV